MGKRVWVEIAPLIATGPPDAHGRVPVQPYKPTAKLSCGHGGSFSVSWVWSTGDPVWCDECESTCLACGAPATTSVTDTLDWGEACEACAALPKRTWPERVEAHRFNAILPEEHLDAAAHFTWVGINDEREAADPKRKFWPEPRRSPLWWTHTREGRAAGAKEMFAKGVMHLVAWFMSDGLQRPTRPRAPCVVCERPVTRAGPVILVDNRRHGGREAHYRCWEQQKARERS